LKSFFEKIFWDTNTNAASNAQIIPKKFVEKPVAHASITPIVRGTSDKYVALAYLIRKNTRYAKTVNNGERPLMVWTSETGICEVAIELSICPSNWNPARGRAVMITSRDGRNMPLRRAGIAVFNPGKSDEQYVRSRHQNDTKANCMTVRVTGLGSAVRMDLEDVLVTADVMYHITQRP
jgi:hypothetical protein